MKTTPYLAHSALLLLALLLPLIGCSGQSPTPAGEDHATMEAASGQRLDNGSFTADLKGVPIHYEVHGSGPVLMTLPNSWGLSLEGLRTVYRPLEQHLTLVYFDPRGMGESGAVREDADMGLAAVREDFDALRRHLGLDRVHAIGWSNGAINLILLASERPEILKSTIFVHATPSFTEADGAAFQEQYPDLAQRWGATQQELLDEAVPEEEKAAELRRLYLDVWFPEMFADPEASREELAELFADTEFSWRHSLYANEELPTYDFTDRLGDIPVPSLVIAGAHDMLPPERVAELHAGIPDSRFVRFEDSGHFSQVEEPVKFQRVVLDFVEGVESQL